MLEVSPGFTEPVSASQNVFRKVLEAMSHPGRIVDVDTELVCPRPLRVAAAATCLTLLDFETPVWVDERAAEAFDWLRFHCGCPRVSETGEAGFILAADGANLPPLDAFSTGEDEYPNRSATVIAEISALGTGPAVSLTGPGIATTTELRVAGLPPSFWADWEANRMLFPRGVDVILTAGSRLTALPRTVRAESR